MKRYNRHYLVEIRTAAQRSNLNLLLLLLKYSYRAEKFVEILNNLHNNIIRVKIFIEGILLLLYQRAASFDAVPVGTQSD